MLKLHNYILLLFSVVVFVVACSNTPNNVSMSLNQGSCALASQYSSSELNNLDSIYESYYNLLINNPSTITPYCTAVTIQNNNSGLNANNIQITNSGLQISTTLPGSTNNTTVALYDTSAAGVTISGFTQNINNIVLFDPNNCATTTGANVQTISANGGSCTFYLEILDELNPVGVYPYYITYNYTNGNQNYITNATLNQRVYLYGGDTTSSGLYYVSTDVMSTGTSDGNIIASWQTGLAGSPESGNVTYVIENAYGMVYFVSLSTTLSTIYSYNGMSINSVGNNLAFQVTSLTFDNNSNIYAATNGNGMWVYNITESNPSWTQMIDTNGNITYTSSLIGLTGYTTNNTIYAFSESQVYSCSVNGTTSESCTLPNPTTGITPKGFFPNSADVDNSGNLYLGSFYNGSNILGISSINSSLSSWSTFMVSPPITESTSSSIGGVIYTNSALYFGVVGITESSVYNCSTSTSNCTPTISSNLQPITGNATTVTTDGVGNLYVAGYNLNSSDFGSTNSTGAFLLSSNYAASSVGTWQPILSTGNPALPEKVSSITVASMLTSY